jgi:hypothetical protein
MGRRFCEETKGEDTQVQAKEHGLEQSVALLLSE